MERKKVNHERGKKQTVVCGEDDDDDPGGSTMVEINVDDLEAESACLELELDENEVERGIPLSTLVDLETFLFGTNSDDENKEDSTVAVKSDQETRRRQRNDKKKKGSGVVNKQEKSLENPTSFGSRKSTKAASKTVTRLSDDKFDFKSVEEKGNRRKMEKISSPPKKGMKAKAVKMELNGNYECCEDYKRDREDAFAVVKEELFFDNEVDQETFEEFSPSIDDVCWKELHDVDPVVIFKNAARFRNLCRLPKAYRWICCEFFYSTLDEAILKSTNDFTDCIKAFFPSLKANFLRRAEWCKIRTLMGKPRRLSVAFLDSERKDLEFKRNRVREIQRRIFSTDLDTKDLPNEIPLHLTIGSRVTALIRAKHSGLYTGTVEGIDLASNSYRISFDQKNLGTASVVDHDVWSEEPANLVSVCSIALKISRLNKMTRSVDIPRCDANSGYPIDGQLGGFPIRFLETVVRLKKVLHMKHSQLQHLKELNAEAEKQVINRCKYHPKELVVKYASCVSVIDAYNEQIKKFLLIADEESTKLCSSKGLSVNIINPQRVKDSCDAEASMLVVNSNYSTETPCVNSKKVVDLISMLSSLMLQINVLSKSSDVLYSCELHSIKQTLETMRSSLDGKNLHTFQNRVEIPINRISAGIAKTAKQESTYEPLSPTSMFQKRPKF